jgi:hypothetical protein
MSGECSSDNYYWEKIDHQATYHEHYLCPDLTMVLVKKATYFAARTWHNAGENFLLQPKGNFASPLSELLKYLVRKASGAPLEVHWTCCRSPIGGLPKGRYIFENGTVVAKEGYRENDKPILSPEEEAAHKLSYNISDSCVTMVCATDKNAALRSTWTGADTGTKGLGTYAKGSQEFEGEISTRAKTTVKQRFKEV